MIQTGSGERKILQVHKNGIKKIKQIITKDGRNIIATGEHKFYVLNNECKLEWKALNDLQVEDTLICTSNTVKNEDEENIDYQYFVGMIVGDGD